MSTIFLMILSRSLWLSGVIVFLFLLRTCFRRIPGRAFYFLWLIVFLGLICPVSLKIPYEATVSPMFPSQTQAEAAQFPEVTVPADASMGTEGQITESESAPTRFRFEDILSPASYLWAAVTFLLILGNLWKILRFRKGLLGARRLKENVYETEAAVVPFVLGFLHPRIYLPINLCETERKLILQHERVHLRRKDYLIKPIALFITSLHWFNPLVWLAYLLFSEDMERACDEAVLDGSNGQIRKQYAASLLALSVENQSAGISTVAFGERRIQYRIMNILHYKKSGALMLLIVIFLMTLVACGTFVQPVEVQTNPTAATQPEETTPVSQPPETTASTQTPSTVAYEDVELDTDIHYPQLTQCPGELTKGYINQSLKAPADQLDELDTTDKKSLTYAVTRCDDTFFSVLYTMTLTSQDGTAQQTMIPVTVQISTGAELTMENAFADPKAVAALLGNEEATAENLQFYLQKDDVVFFFRPEEDQDYVILSLDYAALEPYWNTSFASRPAS